MMNLFSQKQFRRGGFTIVELLIVVVVIAILAAVTIAAYNGIQNRAKDSAAQALASQAAKKLAAYAVTNSDTYPATYEDFLTGTGMSEQEGAYFQYRSTAPYTSYCLTSAQHGVSYFTTNTSPSPTKGGCVGHGVNGEPPVTNMLLNPSFETLSGANVAGITSTGRATAESSTIGALSGSRSLKVTPIYDGSTDTFVTFNSWGIEPNTTYTLMISYTLEETLTSSYPRFRINISGLDRSSPPAGMSAGTHHIRWEYTTPETVTVNFLRIMPGGKLGDPPAYFDNFMIVKGSYGGQYADGTSPGWMWNGGAHASTSKGPALQ